VAVIGDGAVGLCGVIAAKRLGAERIFVLGRHPDRIALARDFGATDIVSERGDEAVERVKELTGGLGVHSVLECVGYEQSMLTALGIARPEARSAASACRSTRLSGGGHTFYGNITISGGPHRPARTSRSSSPMSWRAASSRARPRPDDRPGRGSGRLPRDGRARVDQGDDRAVRLRDRRGPVLVSSRDDPFRLHRGCTKPGGAAGRPRL
jgi:hypothetical protein